MNFRALPPLLLLLVFLRPPAAAQVTGRVTVDMTASHATNRFSPMQALGAGVDSVTAGQIPLIYTPSNIARMLEAGHQPLTYRLYTELGVQAWHWNPSGQWSDPGGAGYFTGASLPQPGAPILVSGQYRLPHRGSTHDQANDDDYSRLSDGDLTTYWKSNPYLSSAFTGEPDTAHPQWVVVDLKAKKPVNACRIVWGNPFAVDFRVQYWHGASPLDDPAGGRWIDFPQGVFTGQAGGTQTLQIAGTPLRVRFLRILMSASSHTHDPARPDDVRSRAGYAIYEIGVGTLSGGAFADLVVHRRAHSQTVTVASSTDPWHRPSDLVTDQEQPGLDRVFTCGLTRGLPAVVPVSLLYGTPEDAAAEIGYLLAQGYAVGKVELGEEPDGQYATPEDYAALYLQWAAAIRSVAADVKLGGPVLSGDNIPWWPDANGDTDWLHRFVSYLAAHGGLADLDFVSLEHYPFSTANLSWNMLKQEPANVDAIFGMMAGSRLPAGFPVYITEANSSYRATVPTLAGAAWHADFVGRFLALGGAGVFLYEYEGLPLSRGSSGWGTFSMFTVDDQLRIQQPLAQFFSTQLINREWAQPVDALHEVYPAASDVLDRSKNALVTAYALKRPDGQWALLLVNKDPLNSQAVNVTFQDGGAARAFQGTVDAAGIGVDDYGWIPDGMNGHLFPDGPIWRTAVSGGAGAVYTLPRGSIVVLRGRVN